MRLTLLALMAVLFTSSLTMADFYCYKKIKLDHPNEYCLRCKGPYKGGVVKSQKVCEDMGMAPSPVHTPRQVKKWAVDNCNCPD